LTCFAGDNKEYGKASLKLSELPNKQSTR
ncbi:hypothetical protein AVDCRST_MAG81-2147, partial [uncultured Synechococcales cyanobacterium]